MSKKIIKIKLIALAFVFTQYSYADSLTLDGRFDYIGSYFDKESDRSSYSGFQMTDMRVDLKGAYKERYSYRLRYNFRKSPDNDSYDNTPKGLEYAYVMTRLYDGLSLAIGKVAVLIGGTEYDYLSSHIYQYSLVGDGFPVFETGATVSYDFLGQSIQLQVINSDKTVDEEGNRAQKSQAVGAVWYGSFLNGSIKPIFGYSEFALAGDNSDKHLAMGIKLTAVNSVLDIDRLQTTKVRSNNDTRNVSSILQIKSLIGKFEPLAKVFLDQSYLDDELQFKAVGFDAALQYYPDTKDNIRYHIVYSSYNKKPESQGSVDTNDYQVLVGTYFNIPVM